MNHKGRKIICRVNADPPTYVGDTHTHVPFFVSTKGYGMYVDTARETTFVCGYKKVGQGTAGALQRTAPGTSVEELYAAGREEGTSTMAILVPAPGVTVYYFEGETITDVVAQYNMFSGGGCDVPEWGLRPIYRCNTLFNGDKIVETAKELKDNGLIVGTIGLEPGWQTKSYSCSYLWNEERYPDPGKTVRELRDLGYHVNLWQHAYVHASAPFHDEMVPYAGDYLVWDGLVPDFSLPEARAIFGKHQKERLIDLGVDGFKLDECDSSDHTGKWGFPYCAQFPSGLDGEQYHALFGTLYAQTMQEALGEDRPILSEIRSMGALAASYPFVLYSDLYDQKDFLRGTVNAGFSGILWTPEVRDAKTREEFLRRVQMNVFSVQCLINAWYCPDMPWRNFDCEKELRELLNVRESLIPMLKEAFRRYHETGVPPVRALVMDYTHDQETYNLDDEYLFCQDLLVAPLLAGQEERKVYLPRDCEWRDYWTKEPVESGWLTVATEGIPVFERA